MVTALFFTAQWCGACKKMYPIVDQLKKEDYKIETVDVDQQPNLAKKYTVSSLPTIIILRDNKEIKRHVGIPTIENLKASLKVGPLNYQIW